MNDYIDSYQNVISSHFNNFPTGLIILSNASNDKSNYIVSYINVFASNIIPLKYKQRVTKYKSMLSSFRKREINNLSKITLWDSLFNFNAVDSNDTYFSDCLMAYIKIKFNNEFIYISFDNLNEERKMLQEKIIKSISFQFLTTLIHEMNNPLHSLINIVDQIHSRMSKRVKLLICLIKAGAQKLIVYSKSIFDSVQCRDKHNFVGSQLEIVNLNFVLMKLTEKYSLLFEYKNIVIDHDDFSLLKTSLFKCDRYYLKELIKNIWWYLYYRVPKDSMITIVYIIQDNNMIKMVFQHEGMKSLQFKRERDNDKGLFDNAPIMIDATINTIETSKEIIKKVAGFLNVKLTFIEEDNVYLSLEFKNVYNENVESNDEEDDVNEFDSPRNYSMLLVPTFSSLETFNNLKRKNPLNVSLSLPGSLSHQDLGSATTLSHYSPTSKIRDDKGGNNQYKSICYNFGKSLANYLEHLKDPIIDNLCQQTKTNAHRDSEDLSPNKSSFIKSSSFKQVSAPKCLKKIHETNSYNNPPKQTATLPELRRNNILLVDDEKFNIDSIMNLLKKEKLSADFCFNGKESLQYLRKNPQIKLVFMDIYMPEMDGLEACKNIDAMIFNNEINPNIAVILVSAHSPESINFQEGQFKSVKRFAKKPMSKQKLQDILKD